MVLRQKSSHIPKVRPLGVKLRTCQKTDKAMILVGALEGEPEQLPPREIAEHLGFRAGHRETACIGRDCHTRSGGVDPIGRGVAQVALDAAIDQLRLKGPVAGNHIADPIVGKEGDDVSVFKVDHQRIAIVGYPFGPGALGIGTLAFALDGVGHLTRPVVTCDVCLVAPAVRGKRDGVVHSRPFGQAKNVERKEDVGKIDQDGRRHRQANQPFAAQKPKSAFAHGAEVGGGHA